MAAAVRLKKTVATRVLVATFLSFMFLSSTFLSDMERCSFWVRVVGCGLSGRGSLALFAGWIDAILGKKLYWGLALGLVNSIHELGAGCS